MRSFLAISKAHWLFRGQRLLGMRSIKTQLDGALGAHGAWLLEPYSDLRSSEGLVLQSLSDIELIAHAAIRNGYQLNTHAIGDRANREILDLYERVFRKNSLMGEKLRFRVEHASMFTRLTFLVLEPLVSLPPCRVFTVFQMDLGFPPDLERCEHAARPTPGAI